MALLLGVDVGTTRVKTLLFDLKGNVVGQASRNCSLLRPRERWVEQDPEELWQALVSTVCAALAQAEDRDRRVIGLSLSTQGGATIPVNASGQPLRKAISWMDERGEAVADEIKGAIDPTALYHYSGWEFCPGLPLLHIAWLRRHEPACYGATRYFLQVNDWLIHRLTGQLRQDPSNAGISQLYNIVDQRWEEQALTALGIAREQLSPLAPSGQAIAPLTAQAAAELGLTTDTWVVNGAHDQYAAALGAGVMEPGQVLLSCGTAWVLLVATAEPAWSEGPGAMAISRHAVAARWGALRSMGGVGTTVEWLVDAILAPWNGLGPGERSAALETLNQRLPQVPIGGHGLFFFPLGGGHAPERFGQRGALWDLTAAHDKLDVGRAALEGIAFELRWLIETVQTTRMPIRWLTMVGGATQSSCWPQIIADVTGRPVTVPAVQEAGARGAGILAGVGLGCFAPQEGFKATRGADRVLAPQKEAQGAYEELYHRYRVAFRAFQASHKGEPGA